MVWDEELIQSVWEKGQISPANDAKRWRKDECGAWIGRQEFGNRESEYGWEIDHVDPFGASVLANLRPLNWRNNAAKGIGPLVCSVTARGSHNARTESAGNSTGSPGKPATRKLSR